MSISASSLKKGARLKSNVPDYETFYVTKKKDNTIKFRADGEDFGKGYLASLPGFKIRYASNMSNEDIEKIEAEWELKIIKETVTC